MLLITTPYATYRLTFSHPEDKKHHSRATICKLWIGDKKNDQHVDQHTGWYLLGDSTTVCSRLDNFVKSRGRKIALQRTLCQHDFVASPTKTSPKCLKCGGGKSYTIHLSKNVRRLIWETYRSQCH